MTLAMNDRLHEAFGPYLRFGSNLPDGREIAPDNLALSIAGRMVDRDPVGKADEIIKLMKPICRRFDIDEMRRTLSAFPPIPVQSRGARSSGTKTRRA